MQQLGHSSADGSGIFTALLSTSALIVCSKGMCLLSIHHLSSYCLLCVADCRDIRSEQQTRCFSRLVDYKKSTCDMLPPEQCSVELCDTFLFYHAPELFRNTADVWTGNCSLCCGPCSNSLQNRIVPLTTQIAQRTSSLSPRARNALTLKSHNVRTIRKHGSCCSDSSCAHVCPSFQSPKP